MRPGSDTASAEQQRRDQSAAAIAAGPAADQPNDLYAGRTRFHHRTHDLGDRELAGVGLLQPYTAGIEQNQHGNRFEFPRGAKQTDQLGTMQLAESAAHETAFLRGNEYR